MGVTKIAAIQAISNRGLKSLHIGHIITVTY